MNKKFQISMMIFSSLGYIVLALSRLLRNVLTDFSLGFCEGFSVVLIVIWFFYMCYCFLKKKNPYRLD